MRIWIDATRPESRLRIFGMTLLERLIRTSVEQEKKLRELDTLFLKAGMDAAKSRILRMAHSQTRPSEIWIELPPSEPVPDWISRKLLSRVPIRWVRTPGSTRERLQRAVEDARGEVVLAFSADSVVDQRIVEQMSWWSGGSAAFISEDGIDCAAALRLEAPLPESPGGETSLLEIAKNAVKGGAIKRLGPEDFENYIRKLRRNLAPYLFRVEDEAAAARIERFLFASNYKGSTDFMTKWVYPPVVWRMLKPMAEHRVHPNLVTFIAILACFGAVPFFAAGMWVPGLILAYAMSVLDSVDGKLARVTLQNSPQGDVLDHGTDLVHPPFWYWAWAWGLSGGDPFAGVFVASLWMAVFYIFDRILEMLFTASTGKSIHGYTELDMRARTFISRRNVNLVVITVALPLGVGVPAFYAIVGWQAASALFHLTRVVKFWNVAEQRARRPAAATARLEEAGPAPAAHRYPSTTS